MSDEATEGTAAKSALGTLADKMNWLIDRTRPAGRGPYTNAELAALIERTTGEQVSHTTVWKLRNGASGQPADEADRGARADLRHTSWLLLR
jgi:hypothetical protein